MIPAQHFLACRVHRRIGLRMRELHTRGADAQRLAQARVGEIGGACRGARHGEFGRAVADAGIRVDRQGAIHAPEPRYKRVADVGAAACRVTVDIVVGVVGAAGNGVALRAIVGTPVRALLIRDDDRIGPQQPRRHAKHAVTVLQQAQALIGVEPQAAVAFAVVQAVHLIARAAVVGEVLRGPRGTLMIGHGFVAAETVDLCGRCPVVVEIAGIAAPGEGAAAEVELLRGDAAQLAETPAAETKFRIAIVDRAGDALQYR